MQIFHKLIIFTSKILFSTELPPIVYLLSWWSYVFPMQIHVSHHRTHLKMFVAENKKKSCVKEVELIKQRREGEAGSTNRRWRNNRTLNMIRVSRTGSSTPWSSEHVVSFQFIKSLCLSLSLPFNIQLRISQHWYLFVLHENAQFLKILCKLVE